MEKNNQLVKLEKISIVLNVKLAIDLLNYDGLDINNSRQIVATAIETLLEDDLGYIVWHRYRNSRNDFYMLGEKINNIKDAFWLTIISQLPKLTNDNYMANIEYINIDLIEINIEKDKK